MLATLNEETRAVFLTYVQGFNALTDELLGVLQERKILLIEDVCESHGAIHNGQKLGSFGWASNFSFYYAHHMSTIEGGMICTDDRSLRDLSHAAFPWMVRESSSQELKEAYWKKHPDLNPDFIFAFPAYNVRNTEIGAIIGRSQLPRLDENNRLRTCNQQIFLENLDSSKYRTDFRVAGSSNYAFNLILQKADMEFTDRLMQRMQEEKIEFRRGSAGGGNQLRQPYLRGRLGDHYHDFPNLDHVHFHGFFIGNFPSLEPQMVREICQILNSVE